MVSTVDRGQPKLSTSIFYWPPPSRTLVDLTRRIPQSRPASRSARPSPSPAPAPGWTAFSDNRTYLAGLESIIDGLRMAGVPD